MKKDMNTILEKVCAVATSFVLALVLMLTATPFSASASSFEGFDVYYRNSGTEWMLNVKTKEAVINKTYDYRFMTQIQYKTSPGASGTIGVVPSYIKIINLPSKLTITDGTGDVENGEYTVVGIDGDNALQLENLPRVAKYPVIIEDKYYIVFPSTIREISYGSIVYKDNDDSFTYKGVTFVFQSATPPAYTYKSGTLSHFDYLLRNAYRTYVPKGATSAYNKFSTNNTEMPEETHDDDQNIYYNLDWQNFEATMTAKYDEDKYMPENVTIPETVSYDYLPFKITGIADSGFSPDVNVAAAGAKSVSFNANIKTFGNKLFYGNRTIETVNFGNQYTFGNFSDEMFRRATKLSKVNIPSSVERIGTYCFSETVLGSVVIPSNVKEIGESAFQYCNGLKSVTFQGDKLTTISPHLFDNCLSLTSIELPGKVERIESCAFRGSLNIKSLVTPASLKYLSADALMTGSLETLTVNALPVPTLEGAETYKTKFSTITLRVPVDGYYYYKNNSSWGLFNIPTKATFTEIVKDGDVTFEKGCLALQRSIANDGGYSAVALPFGTSIADAENVEAAYTFNGFALNNNGVVTMTLKKAAGAIEKDVPFVVKAKSGVDYVKLYNNESYAGKQYGYYGPNIDISIYDWTGESGLVTSSSDKITMYGNYAQKKPGFLPYYVLDEEGKATAVTDENATVKANVIYFKMPQGASEAHYTTLALGLGEGQTTGINDIRIVGTDSSAAPVYTLDGKVASANGNTQGLAKGIYIKNNKKIVIK